MYRVFLILQLISVIEFITWWNTYWTPEERQKQRFVGSYKTPTLLEKLASCSFLFLTFSFLYMQMLPGSIYVNTVLHSVYVWNRGNVFTLCSECLVQSQHIFHHLDCNFVISNDGYVLIFQGVNFLFFSS